MKQSLKLQQRCQGSHLCHWFMALCVGIAFVCAFMQMHKLAMAMDRLELKAAARREKAVSESVLANKGSASKIGTQAATRTNEPAHNNTGAGLPPV